MSLIPAPSFPLRPAQVRGVGETPSPRGTLEARAILADFDPAERRLTVYHSFQAPNMMQDIGN